jgi:hypothetical protein
MTYCPNCRHGKESCQCKQDISYGINEAINTLRVADFQIRQFKMEKKELVEGLMMLLATCPADLDTTKEYENAYNNAKELIHKYKS